MSRATQNTAHFRVTSIQHKHGNFVVFSGVPIHKDTYKVTSARYIVTVITKLSDLPCEPSAGQHWTVNGEKKVTTQSRDNYQYEQHCYEQPRDVLCTLPETGEQLIRFISKERDFRGIGECKARALWQVLGDDFYETLRNDTPKHRETLREILTEDSINALFKGFVKYKNLDAANWLSKIKIPSQIQQRLFRFHQKKTLNLIKENPFTLLKFGMSFNDIDVIAKSYFAVTDNDPRRLSAAVESAINKEVAKGHTYAKHEHLLPHVCRTLKCKDLTSKALRTGIENNQFALNNDTGTYHPVSQLLMESVIAKRFIKLLRNNNRFDEHANIAFIKAKSDLPYPLLDKQSEAVITSLDNSISAITGGAGTGKTTVLRTVLKAFNELHYDIHAVALSGRAAMRLHESIGFNTSTIAAFLRQPAVEPFLTQRLHVLVIDEASMIDTPTMYRLIPIL